MRTQAPRHPGVKIYDRPGPLARAGAAGWIGALFGVGTLAYLLTWRFFF